MDIRAGTILPAAATKRPLLLPLLFAAPIVARQRKLVRSDQKFNIFRQKGWIDHEKDPTERNQNGTDQNASNAFPSPTVICTSNSEGFFGSDSAAEVDVSFEYEVETDPSRMNNTTDDFERSVLPQVERVFTDLILPALFSPQCGVGDVGAETNSESEGVLGSVVGVSAFPDEVVMSGLPCQLSTAHPSHMCTVVDGGLTIFTDGTTNADVEEAIISAIANALNHTTGTFDYSTYHDAIVRVTVIAVEVGGAGDVPPRGASAQIAQTNGNEGTAFPAWGYVAVASGVSIILGAMFAKRRKSQREGRVFENVGQDEDVEPVDANSSLIKGDEDLTHAYDLEMID